jgi:hypothetical protein
VGESEVGEANGPFPPLQQLQRKKPRERLKEKDWADWLKFRASKLASS